jgi:hypothetical protein
MVLSEIRIVGAAIGVAVRESGSSSTRYGGHVPSRRKMDCQQNNCRV